MPAARSPLARREESGIRPSEGAEDHIGSMGQSKYFPEIHKVTTFFVKTSILYLQITYSSGLVLKMCQNVSIFA